MKSNMCVRCVVLIAIVSSGLIISLDGASSPEPSSAELKRAKQSTYTSKLDDDKEYNACIVSSTPIPALKKRHALDYHLSKCFEDANDSQAPKIVWDPAYDILVDDAHSTLLGNLVGLDQSDDVRIRLIAATKAMIMGAVYAIQNVSEVNNLWENFNGLGDAKDKVLSNVEKVVNSFIDDVKKSKSLWLNYNIDMEEVEINDDDVYNACIESSTPIQALEGRLELDIHLRKCLKDGHISWSKAEVSDPNYRIVVEDAQNTILGDPSQIDEVRPRLIAATKAMIMGAVYAVQDVQKVNNLWESCDELKGKKNNVLEKVERVVNSFIDDVINSKHK